MASPSHVSRGTSAPRLGIACVSAAFGSAKRLGAGLPPSPAPICGGQHSPASCWPGALRKMAKLPGRSGIEGRFTAVVGNVSGG